MANKTPADERIEKAAEDLRAAHFALAEVAIHQTDGWGAYTYEYRARVNMALMDIQRALNRLDRG